MSQNITLLGASYADVPAVELPKTGGGTASFTDITDTTAAAADVAQGKYFYDSAGVRTEGTASGGGGGANIITGSIVKPGRTINHNLNLSKYVYIGWYDPDSVEEYKSQNKSHYCFVYVGFYDSTGRSYAIANNTIKNITSWAGSVGYWLSGTNTNEFAAGSTTSMTANSINMIRQPMDKGNVVWNYIVIDLSNS